MSKDQISALVLLALTLLLAWQLRVLALGMADERRPDGTAGGTKLVSGESVPGYGADPLRVALTFDDGPHPVCTAKLLDGLAERGVRATFFLIGQNVPGNEGLVRRMAQEGHLIGNHTYHHVQMAAEEILVCGTELDMTNALIAEITGQIPEFVRPPFGEWSRQLQDEIGMIPVGWDVDPLDWKTEDAGLVAERVLREVENGDIILLHDVYDTSVEAAFLIIDALAREGFEFVTVDELIVN